MLNTKSKAQKQAMILHTAGKLFAAKGYGGTTMDEIAAEANIAKGTLYNYFENKEQLFWTIVCKINNPFMEKLRSVYQAPISAKEKIYRLTYEFLAFYTLNSDICIIMVEEMKALSFLNRGKKTTLKQLNERNKSFERTALREEEFQRYQQLSHDAFSILEQVIEDGIRQKTFKPQPAEFMGIAIFSVLLMSAFTGYIRDIESDARMISETFLNGIVQ